MGKDAFEIYQGPTGYIAVTNPVRRQILAALADAPRELGDLVEMTGKSKPTLSSVHMARLASDGLVRVEPHPSDSRRKVYHLAGERIGASNVPVDALREAVKDYVEHSPLAARFPLKHSIEALVAAPPGTDPHVLQAQGARLGERVGKTLGGLSGQGGPIMQIANFLEQEGLARLLRLDMEKGVLDLGISKEFEGLDGEHLGSTLAGFILGVARASGLEVDEARAEPSKKARECRIHLPNLAVRS